MLFAVHDFPDLGGALFAAQGLSCAVNLGGALADMDRAGWLADHPSCGRLAAVLAGLPDAAPLATIDIPAHVADRQRLANSTRRFAKDPGGSDPATLVEVLIDALQEVRPSPPDETFTAAPELYAVGLVHQIITSPDLLALPRSDLDNEIGQLAAARRDPVGYFVERYQPYVDPDDRFGSAPFVVAGMYSRADVRQFDDQLQPVDGKALREALIDSRSRSRGQSTHRGRARGRAG